MTLGPKGYFVGREGFCSILSRAQGVELSPQPQHGATGPEPFIVAVTSTVRASFVSFLKRQCYPMGCDVTANCGTSHLLVALAGENKKKNPK